MKTLAAKNIGSFELVGIELIRSMSRGKSEEFVVSNIFVIRETKSCLRSSTSSGGTNAKVFVSYIPLKKPSMRIWNVSCY